jgi:hypothetical protein
LTNISEHFNHLGLAVFDPAIHVKSAWAIRDELQCAEEGGVAKRFS